MKLFFITFFIFSFFYNLSFCHTLLKTISPQNNEILKFSPSEISLEFISDIKLIKISLVKENNSKVPLSKDSLMIKSNYHKIKLPFLESGLYKFKWRAISSDGHIIKGGSHFELR